MPAEDVSDLREVVDAINRLCETMKTSGYEEAEYEDCTDATWNEVAVECSDAVNPDELVSPEEVAVQKVETYVAERWSEPSLSGRVGECEAVTRVEESETMVRNEESETMVRVEEIETMVRVEEIETMVRVEESESMVRVEESEAMVRVEEIETMVRVEESESMVRVEESEAMVRVEESETIVRVEEGETVASDTEQTAVFCEPISEMYYTASSEVSLLSDMDLPDRGHDDDCKEMKDDRQNVIAGHVAAMRERFESMTRANTPCPDLIRSLSPSLDVFRNMTPSPDRLDE